jgi:hypothetical protein
MKLTHVYDKNELASEIGEGDEGYTFQYFAAYVANV